MAEVKYMIFKLGEQRYSMKLSDINGIEHIYNIVPVPMGAPCIKGLIHLRNNVIPVYDLKEKFCITEEPVVCNRQLLISETHGIYIGFEVDDVIGILPVSEDDVKDTPMVVATEDTEYVENVVKVFFPEENKSELLLSVSVDRIMSELDFERVSEAVARNKTQA